MKTTYKRSATGLTACLTLLIFFMNSFSAHAQNAVETDPVVLETTISDGQTSVFPFTITNTGNETLDFVFPGYESSQRVVTNQNISQIIESNSDSSDIRQQKEVIDRYLNLGEAGITTAERKIIERFEQRNSDPQISPMSQGFSSSYDIEFEDLNLQGEEFMLVDEVSVSGVWEGFAGDFVFEGGSGQTWANDLTILFTTSPELDPHNPENVVYQIGGLISYAPTGFILYWGDGNSEAPGTTVDVAYGFDPTIEINDLYIWIGNGWQLGEGTWTGSVSLFGLSSQPNFITSVEPAEGTIAPGESASVDATFDAEGFNAGTYNGNLRMMLTGSEDSEELIPVVMNVGEMPGISVEPSALEFGDVFIGQTKNLSVSIVNTGNSALMLSDFAVDSDVFSVPISGAITVGPSMSLQVAIAFTPDSTGDFEGEFTFSTNNPEVESVSVPLNGSGLSVPVFSVNPLNFELSLETGESTTFDITIANDGEGELLYSIPRFDAEEALRGNKDLIRSMQQRAPFVASEENLTAINERNLLERYRAGLIGDFSAEAESIIRNMNRAAEGSEVTPGLLSLSSGEVIEFEDFEISGGQFVPATGALSGEFEGVSADFVLNSSFGQTWANDLTLLATSTPELDLHDQDSILFQIGGTVSYSSLKFNWGMGNSDAPGTAVNVTLELIPPVELEEVYFWIGNGWTDHATGSWTGSIELNGLGGTDPFITDAVPSSGSLAPGDEQIVSLTIDATGLNAGSYTDLLNIVSNDINSPSAQVLGTLFVSGTPEISLSTDEIDFGTAFTGGNTSEGLVITNSGTDILEVSSVTSDNPEFLVDGGEFTLLPDETAVVEIIFAPESEGEKSGSITVSSNADSGDASIALTGTAVNPGILSVDPESLSFELNQGETGTAMLTLSNVGESDLEYTISTFGSAGSGARSIEVGNTPAGARILPEFMAVGRNASQRAFNPDIELMNEEGDIIWDQPSQGFDGIFSNLFPNGFGAYSADTFILENTSVIGSITAYGFLNSYSPPGSLNPYGATFYIFEDDNGKPAGIPNDGNDNHIFKFEASPGMDGFSVIENQVDHSFERELVLNIEEATGSGLQLGAGKYWLSVFVNNENSNSDADTWYWSLGASDKNEASFVDPENIFHLDLFDWENIEPFVGFGAANLAFTLRGIDINFLSFNPVSILIGPGESVEIPVLADAQGLEPGEYFAELNITTNSPVTPEKSVPVTLQVNEAEVGLRWGNLHYPAEVTINQGEDFMIHGLATVDEEMQANADEMVRMWVGFHTSDVHPALWEEEVWIEGHFHQHHDEAAEFIVNAGSHLPAGEYYYAVRYQMEGYDYSYGGYHEDGGGFWTEGLHVSGHATVLQSTSTSDDNQIPQSFALNQNYPNPFNPTTIISYDLPEAADVRLEVYNIQGQRVATLVNTTQNAGSYTVNFDATRLSSGVYIYRIQAGTFTRVRKMTLVK